MKSSKRYVSILAVLFAISISLAFISGCSQNAVAPVQDDPSQPKLGGRNFDFATRDANDIYVSHLVTDTTVSARIGPKGGLLQVKLGNSLPTVFRFPAGALKVQTLITIHGYFEESASGKLAVYDCGPEGTVFAVPLEVTQPEPLGKASADLFYFNETSWQWELQETSFVKNGSALFHIYHFSKYGIG